MPFVCCVPGCNEIGKANLHSFPKNQNQCKTWSAATSTHFVEKETAWKSYYKVCRKHFQETDLRNGNLLKKDVVPSRMLPHCIILEHDYCAKNSIIINSVMVEEHLNIDSSAIDTNGNLMDVDEISELNKNSSSMKHQVDAAEPRYDGVALAVELVAENNTTRDVNAQMYPPQGMEVESSNETDDADKFETLEPVNKGECISEDRGTSISFSSVTVQENPVSKSTRTYDTVARKMRYLQNRNKVLSSRLKEMQSANLKSNCLKI